MDRHFKSWNLVQEVVSEALVNNIVNTDYSHEKNPQASLACFCMEAMVISICVHIFSPKKTGPREWKFHENRQHNKGKGPQEQPGCG